MDFKAILMGLGFALMWASAFTTTRMIVLAAPPLTALVIRFALSAVVAVGLARAMGQHWRLSRAEWRTVIVFGLCQNALYLGLNWVAMQYVEASAAAIIASVMLSSRIIAPLAQLSVLSTRFNQARTALTILGNIMQSPNVITTRLKWHQQNIG